MSYDFTLRRQIFRTGRTAVRIGVIAGRAIHNMIKKRQAAIPKNPYMEWEESPNKEQVMVYFELFEDAEDDELVELGQINMDLKAPVDVLREYVRRNFREMLNQSTGDSFSFKKVGVKSEIVPRSEEAKKYTKDLVQNKMNRATMESVTCVLLVAEPGAKPVIIDEINDNESLMPSLVDKEADGAAADRAESRKERKAAGGKSSKNMKSLDKKGAKK